MRRDGERAEPDIEIAAAVRGRELRFRTRPEVALDANEVSAGREGLPRPVQAGVTYGPFRAWTRLTSRLRAR
jgi:hypothetical protein